MSGRHARRSAALVLGELGERGDAVLHGGGALHGADDARCNCGDCGRDPGPRVRRALLRAAAPRAPPLGGRSAHPSPRSLPPARAQPPAKLSATARRLKEYPCRNIETVDFDEATALIAIGDEAFKYLAKITELTFPPNLETIGQGAFKDATALRSVDFSQATRLRSLGVALVVGDDSGMDAEAQKALGAAVENGVFANAALEAVTLPPALEVLGDAAFLKNVLLARVTFPSTLRTIGAGAFIECTALERLALPPRLTVLGTGVFSKCKNLITVSEGDESGALPPGLRRINDGTFNGCAKLGALLLPDSVTYIGFAAFQQCVALDALKLPARLRTIAAGAFDGCAKLWVEQSVELPRRLSSIGKLAFQGTGIRSPDDVVWNGFECEDVTTRETQAFDFVDCDAEENARKMDPVRTAKQKKKKAKKRRRKAAGKPGKAS